MYKLKLTSIGKSTGVVLPKEILAQLKLKKGDILYLTETPDGFRITLYDPKFEEQMNLAHTIMKKRRDALRALA